MTRETIIEQIENNNDEVGSVFNRAVKEVIERYESGVIHHEEYINSVEKACYRAKKELITIKYESKSI